MATMASDQTTAQQVTSFFYLFREAPVEKKCFLGTDHPGGGGGSETLVQMDFGSSSVDI